ncbi:MAG: PhoH family protein [Kiritimatiellia bacterium]
MKKRARKSSGVRKTFVLDTNVLLHNPQSLESFSDNRVVIPMAVIEELDKFKTHNDELGRNARHVIRRIDSLRTEGSLRDGVPLPSGGVLQIRSALLSEAEGMLVENVPDNLILRLAYELITENEDVIFVSKDINARLKADALGLQVMDFEKEKVNFDELYTGYTEMTVPLATINGFFKNRVYKHSSIGSFPNEFVLMRERTNRKRGNTALARVLEPGTLVHLSSDLERVWNIAARNREQRLALELLMDPSVQIVTLVGQAGTGKTLLALAAALQSTLRNHRYDGILVSRPIIPMGKDIGYLPGAKEEKLAHWMQPIFDNLTFLMNEPGEKGVAGKKKTKVTPKDRIEALLHNDTVVLEALTYIRGRSIPNQYVIVDEAQNLTPHEVKTIVSRAGENTKMVLTGDPYQIDNPYLDASSNGLTYATERLKSLAIHGHVTLQTSERSSLAAVAAQYL